MTVEQPDLCVVCYPDKVGDLAFGVAPVLIPEILPPKIVKKEMQLITNRIDNFRISLHSLD